MEALKRAVTFMQYIDDTNTYDEIPQDVVDGGITLESAKAYCAAVLRRWNTEINSQQISKLIRGLEAVAPGHTPSFTFNDVAFDEKFLVVKWADIGSLLNICEQNQLTDMLNKINAYRHMQGKKVNTYLVINTDEPYAKAVAELMVANKHCSKQSGYHCAL